MKLITAVIQPHALDVVQTALVHLGIAGMTISEVTGYARQRGHREHYRGETLSVDFVLKVKLEVLARDEHADAIVGTIAKAASSGEAGDGKIWVTRVEDVVRISSGEHGEMAI